MNHEDTFGLLNIFAMIRTILRAFSRLLIADDGDHHCKYVGAQIRKAVMFRHLSDWEYYFP